MIRDSTLVTYIDGVKRLVLDVKLEIGVASVIESLPQTAESISEDLSADFWLGWCFSSSQLARAIFALRCWLCRSLRS